MRRANDFYPTPEFATRELLQRVRLAGNVLECCVGDGAISGVLPEAQAPSTVFRNDIDISHPADFHEDVSLEEGWTRFPYPDRFWEYFHSKFPVISRDVMEKMIQGLNPTEV